MPWYKSGTVNITLNSSAVIGVGTSFIANSRVGDAFRGPDGGWYEVTNIASDTAMSIAPTYKGATVAGGSYALAPMQGYVKDSADALRAIVNTYGVKLAALRTTGNYDILPVAKGGTGLAALSAVIQGLLNDADAVEARATLGAAKSGANSDILSLTGMTTALSVAQGGTGGKTQSAARVGLGLGSAAIKNVGTSPGEIIEVGAYGIGIKDIAMSPSMNQWKSGFYGIQQGNTEYITSVGISSGCMVAMGFPFGLWGAQLYMGQGAAGSVIGFRAGDYSTAPFCHIYHTGNVTRAADGTLKGV